MTPGWSRRDGIDPGSMTTFGKRAMRVKEPAGITSTGKRLPGKVS